jgi:hypothetical protein
MTFSCLSVCRLVTIVHSPPHAKSTRQQRPALMPTSVAGGITSPVNVPEAR